MAQRVAALGLNAVQGLSTFGSRRWPCRCRRAWT